MHILGISGRMKSGKDYTADLINKLYNIKHPYARIYYEPFAKPLKEMLISTFGFERDCLYTQRGKASFNTKWNMTYREILQKTGTDAIRKHLHPDAWNFAFEQRLRQIKEENTSCIDDALVLVPDVRFVNEAETIRRNRGKIIYIDRPSLITSRIKIMEMLHLIHPSERPLPKELRDYTIVNDSNLLALNRKITDLFYTYNDTLKHAMQ